MREKGWFIIDGVQAGDRTLEQQMTALWPAVAEASGKTVLDLGCAEGLIGREFAEAGAVSVFGVDAVYGHLDVAREQCAGYPMTFERRDLRKLDEWPTGRFDIVLALGIIHKLHEPHNGLIKAMCLTGSLLLLRSGKGASKGVIRSKFEPQSFADSHRMLKTAKFTLERVEKGSPEFDEDVEYWRR